MLIQDKKTIPGCINQIEVAINMLKDSIFVSSTNFGFSSKKNVFFINELGDNTISKSNMFISHKKSETLIYSI